MKIVQLVQGVRWMALPLALKIQLTQCCWKCLRLLQMFCEAYWCLSKRIIAVSLGFWQKAALGLNMGLHEQSGHSGLFLAQPYKPLFSKTNLNIATAWTEQIQPWPSNIIPSPGEIILPHVAGLLHWVFSSWKGQQPVFNEINTQAI